MSKYKKEIYLTSLQEKDFLKNKQKSNIMGLFFASMKSTYVDKVKSGSKTSTSSDFFSLDKCLFFEVVLIKVVNQYDIVVMQIF